MPRGRPRKNKESSINNEHDDSFRKAEANTFRKAVIINSFSFPVKPSPFHSSVMSHFSRGTIIKNESLARDMKKANKPIDIIEV
jgi:hypothetical protein